MSTIKPKVDMAISPPARRVQLHDTDRSTENGRRSQFCQTHCGWFNMWSLSQGLKSATILRVGYGVNERHGLSKHPTTHSFSRVESKMLEQARTMGWFPALPPV
eukprot:scaffold36436_cov176-Amphora_coffeaeformis.AAC.7